MPEEIKEFPPVETTLYRMNGTLINIKNELEKSNERSEKLEHAINLLTAKLDKCNWNFGVIAKYYKEKMSSG